MLTGFKYLTMGIALIIMFPMFVLGYICGFLFSPIIAGWDDGNKRCKSFVKKYGKWLGNKNG